MNESRGYTSTDSTGPPELTEEDKKAVRAVIDQLWRNKKMVWNTFDPEYCHRDPQGAAEMIQILSDALQVAKLSLWRIADLRGSLMEGVSEMARDGLKEIENELSDPRRHQSPQTYKNLAVQHDFHNIDDVVEIRKLKAALEKISGMSCVMGHDRGHSGIEAVANEALGKQINERFP